MARQTIVAEFHDYGAAHRAFSELLHGGVGAGDISIIAGDRSDRHGAQRDFGILDHDADRYLAAVRRGLTLLAVRVDEEERGRIRRLIACYAPAEIEDAAAPAVRSLTLSGAPADRGASPGELPDAGRGSDWLVRQEGDLAADVDPEAERG